MSRLLLVEDEEALATALAQGLREESYIVDRASDGAEALWAARSGLHDALILDVRIPGPDGVVVCQRLRDERVAIPILMLTACDSTEDVVRGLDAGADDYVTKPFDFVQLLARLRALLRRGSAGTSSRLVVDDLVLDLTTRKASRSGEEVALTETEYRLLELMMRNAGRVLARERLAAALWEDELGPCSNSLEVHVANLRRKIDGAPDRPRLLQTRRGVGYVLAAGSP
ncbi:MAG: response regulator transcription factor [Planctomycetota bacterium]